MVSEPLQDPLGHLLSGFRYRVTHHLCPRTKPNSAQPPFLRKAHVTNGVKLDKACLTKYKVN
ncbi:hypothetical protein MTR_0519s0010 [Medicago truncatula]|uniref:Uncharacterized protein n=1 Tax=Medicago truncatula TaxID=3880 RepID=A0A072TQJ3_MEDTR|nr:hypothetical protein MTR_0519s0010 [Medicago truncatula]